jgi:hypothetical protein
MLITAWPLFSSKSFHKTYQDVEAKLTDVFSQTDDYYEKMGREFNYNPNWYTGEYPGIFLYKIWPQKPHLMRLIGKPKACIKPEINDGLDTCNRFEAGDGQDSEDIVST